MVKKLIKYDFHSYFRLLFPVQLILIGIACVNRFIQFFENMESSIYKVVFISSLVLYCVGIIVLMLMTGIFSIVRFYQGMYTNEGYLSHTLPVTPAQHILAKLLTSLIFYFGSLLTVFLSFIALSFGEVNIELFKSLGYLVFKVYLPKYGADGVLYIIEGLLLLIVLRITSFLLYYFCITVGQMVSKKKILLAFGVYFGLYVLSQMIATIFIIIISLDPEWLQNLSRWLSDNPLIAMHIYLRTYLVVDCILGTVYFVLTKTIMSKKLNLT